jgi:hypothetical protein
MWTCLGKFTGLLKAIYIDMGLSACRKVKKAGQNGHTIFSTTGISNF